MHMVALACTHACVHACAHAHIHTKYINVILFKKQNIINNKQKNGRLVDSRCFVQVVRVRPVVFQSLTK